MDYNQILRQEVQAFISKNLSQDLTKFLLSGQSPFPEIPIQELARQIKGRQIAIKKIPHFAHENWVFPPHLNLEQSSSEATARYKASLFYGESLVDLTCGFAVDAYWLGQNFNQITLVESNEKLLQIVKCNLQKNTNYKVFYHNLDLNEFLSKNQQNFSLVYLDPARRDLGHRRKFLLEDLSPDIVALQSTLLERGKQVLIKLSPLFDLAELKQKIKGLKEIHIVAVKNEVKELLVVLAANFKAEPSIKCINLKTKEAPFTTNFPQIKEAVPEYGEPEAFLYLPNHAVLKSGAFNEVAQRFNLKKLHPNTHLYTASKKVLDFPGRVLAIESVSSKTIPKGSYFNIISKNHPLKPEQIKKKYKLKDGGLQYLIFTQSLKGKIILKSI